MEVTYILIVQVEFSDTKYIWFHELIQGSLARITSESMYFTRGYSFHAYDHNRRMTTSNYRICVKSKTHFYEVLQKIFDVKNLDLVMSRHTLFECQ